MKNLSGLLTASMIVFCANGFYGASNSYTSNIDEELVEKPKNVFFETTTLNPKDDAYLQGSTRYNNDVLRLEQGNRRVFLKFDAGTINGQITSVQLNMNIYSDTGNGTVTVYEASSSSWLESDLNTTNAPSKLTTLGSRSSSGSGLHSYNLSLNDLSVYSGNFSLILEHTGSNDLSYASMENTNATIRPELVITYTPNTNGGNDASTSTNLLDVSTWVAGDSPLSEFVFTGSQSENVRASGIVDPRGNTNTIVWKSINDAGNDWDAGWYSREINIDHTKSYRFTVWIKKTGTDDGYTLFGPKTFKEPKVSTTLNLKGEANTNPYFSGFTDPPAFNEWFLYVGYVHGSGYQSEENIGAIYNANQDMVRGLIDFKMSTSATKLLHRAFLYGDTNTNNVQYLFEPTIYEVNDQMPDISELMNPTNSGGGNPSTTGGYWTKSDASNNIFYNNANAKVGIGTTNLQNFELSVNGEIRAKEIKVETGWADYVFLNDYKLPTLKEVEQHIDEKGHLINIPSAAEIEANGVELGEMNKLLLEKIEELMLYIIQQDKRINALEKSLK